MSILNDKIGNSVEMNEKVVFDIIEEYLCMRRSGLDPDITKYIEKIRSTANDPVAGDLIIIAQRLEMAFRQLRTDLSPEEVDQSYQRCRKTMLSSVIKSIQIRGPILCFPQTLSFRLEL